MSRIRIVGIMLVAAFAMSAVAASAASAAAPEFRHKGGEVVKRKFKSTTGVAKLDAAGTVVTCASSSTAAGAEIEKGNAAKEQKNVKGVVVTFKKCESENSNKEKCKVHSKGKVEEIKTESLSGELGKVAKAEAADERGLDLKPTTGKIFVTLEGTCLPISPSPVEGSVIGEPTKKEEIKGKLVFATSGGKQAIQKFEGGVKDTLEVFKIAEATEETTATNTFEEAVEVT
jgi:Fe-S cluster biogenesis protein NfuA